MSDTEEQPTKKIKLNKDELAGLPAGAKPLSHQVAGHASTGGTQSQKKGGFYECEDGTILKALHPDPDPRGPREVEFYQKVYDPTSKDPIVLELRSLVPKYIGVVSAQENDKTVKYLQLEDITSKYKKPCVIDIKIGKITYDPDASEEKKRKESTKYPPLQKIGFQLRGFRVYSASKGDYEFFSKKFMHELDENTILSDGLKVYFSLDGKLCTDVVNTTLEKLLLIQKWFEKQKQFAFFASSVLIVYEGLPDEHNTQNGSKSSEPNDTPSADKDTKQEDDVKKSSNEDIGKGNKPLVDVRMIDFAHVFPATAVDENYSYGLESLINYLRKLGKEEK